MYKNNKWSVVFGSVLLQICIGAIYTWSLFNQPLIDKFGFENQDVVLTYSIAIFMFAFSTMFSGRLNDKIGPKKVATIGVILYSVGVMLTSLATSLFELYIYYGVIAGIGVGFVYVCPLSTCIKWFPNKKGFITGIAVGAFGLGSLAFKFVIQYFINSYGVSTAFLYLGLVYLVLGLIGAQFLKLPENSYTSYNDCDDNLTTLEMIKTKTFYIIWVMFLFGCMSGLLVIGLAKDIGVQLANLDALTAANAVPLISLFNASGRLIWGSLSDRLGRLKVINTMFFITSISMISMSILNLNYATFFICLAFISFCFGGFLSVFPTLVGDLFGIKNLSSNYGIVYQAYGIAALVGPIIVSSVGSLKTTFMISSLLSALGIILTLVLKSKYINKIQVNISKAN